MDEVAQRINRIMIDKGMIAAEFSKAIGIQTSSMSHITLGRNKPSLEVVKKITKRFKDINPNWLLHGEEPMKIISEKKDDGLIRSIMPSGKGKERDLFDSPQNPEQSVDSNTSRTAHAVKTQPKPTAESNNRKETYHSEEIRQAGEVNQSENERKTIEKEVIIYKERPSRTIEKLLIFYSDHTYETFVPEKTDS